jgi:hypothetical protein
MNTILTAVAVVTTQPAEGYRRVTDIPETGFYWGTALLILAVAVVAFFVIRSAVLSALRRHAKESHP